MATRIALQRAAVLERLAADLRSHTDETDPLGCKRIADVAEALFIGTRAEIDRHGLRTLRRVRVPRADIPRRAIPSET